MRADFRPTREKIVAAGWVLLLTFGALLIILAVCVYQWRQSNLRYAEFMAREKPLSEAFHAVYQKLMAGQAPAANPAEVFIHPRDIRNALARGPDELGELPTWVTGDGVYISRAEVPLNSGKFICFVLVNTTNLPYGLTSAGECRNADIGEIFPQDFVLLRPPPGH
jgi:hypothetical protein